MGRSYTIKNMAKKQKPDPYALLLESWGERAEKYAENRKKWGSCPECGSALKAVAGYVRCLEFPRCLYRTTQDDARARVAEKKKEQGQKIETHTPQRGGVGGGKDGRVRPGRQKMSPGSLDPDPGPDMSFVSREWWSESELARFLGVHIETVRRHRRSGKGPPYLTEYRTIRYRRDDVESWIKQNLSKPSKK